MMLEIKYKLETFIRLDRVLREKKWRVKSCGGKGILCVNAVCLKNIFLTHSKKKLEVRGVLEDHTILKNKTNKSILQCLEQNYQFKLSRRALDQPQDFERLQISRIYLVGQCVCVKINSKSQTESLAEVISIYFMVYEGCGWSPLPIGHRTKFRYI